MRERPIPFSAPMVRAILDGTKTQTRRVVKLPKGVTHVDAYDPEMRAVYPEGPRPVFGLDDEPNAFSVRNPYGGPGDQLWVKEAIRAWTYADDDESCVEYAADGHIHDDATWVWKRDVLPGMFMPRGLSRITLEITDVRVERLQDCSDADAEAEGIGVTASIQASTKPLTPVQLYAALWDSINKKRGFGWDANPWVWVVTFRRVEAANGR